jgi:hypothetical protein
MEKFSLAVAKIEMFRQGESLILGATGTGFFYKSDNETFLVTNWHNVTGINPQTEKPLHTKGLLPNILRVHYKQWADAFKTLVRNQHLDLPLYRNERPVWFEHSTRRNVDVVAIHLSLNEFHDFANEHINTVDQELRLEVYAGMDCFILGFPEGLFGAANTPIWKRGSIASEPYQQHPYLVDSATRKGMSGAPVIARHSGILGKTRKKGVGPDGSDIFGTVEKFVAIYSGRIGDDSFGYQLGTAWQSNVLNDICSGRLPGEQPLSI